MNILCNKLGVTYVGFFAIVYLAQTLIAYKGMKILDSVHNNYVEKPKTFGACTFFAIYFGYFGMFYGAVVIRTGLALSLMFWRTLIIKLVRIKKRYVMRVLRYFSYVNNHSVIDDTGFDDVCEEEQPIL